MYNMFIMVKHSLDEESNLIVCKTLVRPNLLDSFSNKRHILHQRWRICWALRKTTKRRSVNAPLRIIMTNEESHAKF